jgi:hypothetical protein
MQVCASRVLGVCEARRFHCAASDGSDCRDRDVGRCRRVAGHDEEGLLPYAITSAPVGQVLPDGYAGTETAKTVQETSRHADQPPRALARAEMGTGSTTVRCSLFRARASKRNYRQVDELPFSNEATRSPADSSTIRRASAAALRRKSGAMRSEISGPCSIASTSTSKSLP